MNIDKLLLREGVKKDTSILLPGALRAKSLVVLRSSDGESWRPVRPEDVPEWVKDPDTMGRLVKGDMASRGHEWYRAVDRIPTDIRTFSA